MCHVAASLLIAGLSAVTAAPARASGAPAGREGTAEAEAPAGPRAGAALRTVPVGRRLVSEPFSLLGVTWTDPRARLGATLQVRTRATATGRWGAWQLLEADGGIRGTRGATDPLWVGPSDGVETRVLGRGQLPAGTRVDLIDPRAGNPGSTAMAPADPAGDQALGQASGQASGQHGRQTSGQASGPTSSQSARQTGGWAARTARRAVALPARPVPRMITRAGWGADEGIVKGTPEYTGDIEIFFVHHTASGNGYSCAQSASIVRGIQTYQVKSRGWDDIGYNFLVDKCGTIFEGRAGGVGRSVLGAHTLGFNENASAVAVIGTYGGSGIPARAKIAVSTLAAYKLGAYGNAPNSRVTLTSRGSDRFPAGRPVTLNRISGHRDTGRTDCPGDALYAQLPSIRAIAGAGPVGLRVLPFGGAIRSGAYSFTKGLVRPLWNVSTPSALISRFEVYVDGVLTVAAPGSHRAATLRLTPGGHTVIVRAVHLSGRSTTVTSRVIADPNAPVFTTGPEVVLRLGSLNGTVPIRLDWRATDPNLAGVTLVRPSTVPLGATATSRNGTIRPAVPTTFVLRATDRAGNAVNASVTRTPVVAAEAAAVRTGPWRVLRNPAHLGGAALGATTAGASATWTFTGRSAALAVGRAATSGRVRIFVDGVDQGLVDLRSPRPLYRQAVWARWWGASAQHTVRVQVDRPGVVLDGLVTLR